MPGEIVDSEGRVIGEHKGYQLYTVGQRRGLGIAAKEPYYVKKVLPASNRIVCGKKNEIFGSELFAKHLNLIAVKDIRRAVRVKAKATL